MGPSYTSNSWDDIAQFSLSTVTSYPQCSEQPRHISGQEQLEYHATCCIFIWTTLSHDVYSSKFTGDEWSSLDFYHNFPIWLISLAHRASHTWSGCFTGWVLAFLYLFRFYPSVLKPDFDLSFWQVDELWEFPSPWFWDVCWVVVFAL